MLRRGEYLPQFYFANKYCDKKQMTHWNKENPKIMNSDFGEKILNLDEYVDATINCAGKH